MKPSASLRMALLAASVGVALPHIAVKPERAITSEDLERIEAARIKRDRKAKRRIEND